jgi:hypothetical protein
MAVNIGPRVVMKSKDHGRRHSTQITILATPSKASWDSHGLFGNGLGMKGVTLIPDTVPVPKEASLEDADDLWIWDFRRY